METKETETKAPKTISVVDFTAFNVRAKKMFEDKDEQHIIVNLKNMCETHVLHSITTYGISSMDVKEFTKPFEPSVEQASKYLSKNEQQSGNGNTESANTENQSS